MKGVYDMPIESPEQPQGHQKDWSNDTGGEIVTKAPDGSLSADAHPGARLAPDAGQEIPSHDFDNTPLGDAHDPETIVIPDSPAILVPEKKPFWTKPKKIGAAIAAVL